jgi:hypothetical protein
LICLRTFGLLHSRIQAGSRIIGATGYDEMPAISSMQSASCSWFCAAGEFHFKFQESFQGRSNISTLAHAGAQGKRRA